MEGLKKKRLCAAGLYHKTNPFGEQPAELARFRIIRDGVFEVYWSDLIDPSELQVIGVKTAVAYRQACNRIAKSSFTVRTPGPGTSDLPALSYRKIRRPIYALHA